MSYLCNLQFILHRQVAELTMIVLGETPPRGVHTGHPIAVHQARWMGRVINTLLMYLYHDQAGYDEHTVEQLGRMVMFLVLFYVPHWMMTRKAADAPLLDLQLHKDLIKYRQVDAEVADAVREKLRNHGWYLSEETVPFVCFSTHQDATDEVKRAIASKLCATPKPKAFGQGRPIFPKEITEETSLSDLIGPQSHVIFDLLRVSSTWLESPVVTWGSNKSYVRGQNVIKNMKVTNDVAERSVKMMSDFADKITADPSQRQHLLQVVEFHRRRYPNYKKKTLEIK